jgi:prepilin peptidase CpaA
MLLVLSASALALFAAAAATDAVSRRIPNALTLALALVGLARIGLALASGDPLLPLVGDLAAAVAVFALAAVGFHFRLLGGGDVKLLAAGALWLGAAALVPYLTATVLAGGLLALLFVGWHLAMPGRARPTLPYGIAIALAGILTTGGMVGI